VDRTVVPFGAPHPERADAVRNREHLLKVARAMLAEQGADKVTMDGLAERACLGKGTVFRRFGSRAGIFAALLDSNERAFQQRVLSGPPPLGPGADPVHRLVAYGRARIAFLVDHHAIAWAAMDRNPATAPRGVSMSQPHIRMLLSQARLGFTDVDTLAVQLTAALDGPLLLYLAIPEPADEPTHVLADSWQTLIERLCRPA
jgi:polyketide synthase 12